METLFSVARAWSSPSARVSIPTSLCLQVEGGPMDVAEGQDELMQRAPIHLASNSCPFSTPGDSVKPNLQKRELRIQ